MQIEKKMDPAWLVLLLILTTQNLSGMWAVRPEHVPLQRLLSNLSTHLKTKPNDAEAYYALGRLHSLAFANETEKIQINAIENKLVPGFLPWESIMVKREAQTVLSAKMRNHLIDSVHNYQRATQLAPDKAYPLLGLGWMLETGAVYAGQIGPPPGRSATASNADIWKERALAAYRQAYAMTINTDLAQSGLGPGADPSISLEAGQGIDRILSARKRSNDEESELIELRGAIAKLARKPRAVTPIIFSLEGMLALDELLAKNSLVSFDLAGDGKRGWWPWVKPETGILVWDPAKRGRITSGLQLFGSSTWWISWRDGYQPLAALDDDHDGWLTGREMRGLAVWRDRNCNGISEPGEVLTAFTLGIERIAARATEHINGMPANSGGIKLKDGTILPSYDWTPTEVKETVFASLPVVASVIYGSK